MELYEKVYSDVVKTIEEKVRYLRDKYGIVRIEMEDDTSSNDLPFAEFFDGKNTFDKVDLMHRMPKKEAGIVSELLKAVKLLERLVSDEVVEIDVDGVKVKITFI